MPVISNAGSIPPHQFVGSRVGEALGEAKGEDVGRIVVGVWLGDAVEINMVHSHVVELYAAQSRTVSSQVAH